MPFSKLHTSSASDLPTTIGRLATLLEFWISSAAAVGYITALSFFLAYNTLYKYVDMSALYALKYAEMFKIPVAFGAVVAVGTCLASLGSAAARGLTNVGGGVASTGGIIGGAIGKVMALPEDLICSIIFKRQCPQTAEFVEALRRSGEVEGAGEKMPLLVERGKEGDEMV